jgi:hypothetical protein
MDGDGDLVNALTESMALDGASGEGGHVYRVTVPFKESGKFGFMLRIMPEHPLLVHSADMGLVVWG